MSEPRWVICTYCRKRHDPAVSCRPQPPPPEPAGEVKVEERHRQAALRLEDIACGYGGALSEERMSRLAQWAALYEQEVREAERERAVQIVRRPRIHDAMSGYVAVPDFAEDMVQEIEAAALRSGAASGEGQPDLRISPDPREEEF